MGGRRSYQIPWCSLRSLIFDPRGLLQVYLADGVVVISIVRYVSDILGGWKQDISAAFGPPDTSSASMGFCISNQASNFVYLCGVKSCDWRASIINSSCSHQVSRSRLRAAGLVLYILNLCPRISNRSWAEWGLVLRVSGDWLRQVWAEGWSSYRKTSWADLVIIRPTTGLQRVDPDTLYEVS